MNGETATVTKNEDGTLSISYTFSKTALTPVTITLADKEADWSADGIAIPVEGMFTITEGAGEAAYSVENGTGEGTYDAQTGKLTVTKCGTFTVKVSTAATDTYAAGAETSATLTVNKVDSAAATVTANTLTYTGLAQALVTVTGEATGGTMQYALGTATEATEQYTTSIPTATEAGTYYVWYKVVGDENHNDAEPACVAVTIAEPEKEPESGAPRLSGSGHVQGTGDKAATKDGGAIVIGTTGESRRLEALTVSLPEGTDGAIAYRAHVQGIGWAPAAADGAVVGTTGESRRIEAVRVSLSGELGADYSVWYRVHSQTWGWLGWAHDGADAGTTGLSRRAEAVEVQVLPKRAVPDGYDAAQAACRTR